VPTTVRRSLLACLAATALAPLAAPAQWPPHAAAGVPRTADGSVDLEAPAPRTADGHPDLSGLWERVGPGGINPDFEALQSKDGGPPAATFWNLGAGFATGLPYQPLAEQLRAERMSNNQKNTPDARCLPMGLMQLHLHPQPRKIVQTPGLIIIMYEGNEGLRQIFTDGRPLPLSKDVLRETLDDRMTVELDRFNLECDLRHGDLQGTAFGHLRDELDSARAELSRAASLHGGRVAMIGILPTLVEADLGVDRHRAV